MIGCEADAVDQQVGPVPKGRKQLGGIVTVCDDELPSSSSDVGRQVCRITPGEVDLPAGGE